MKVSSYQLSQTGAEIEPLVLTWISLYQFSRAGPAASFRIYYEITRNNERFSPPSEAPSIPLGVSLFPKELVGFPTR